MIMDIIASYEAILIDAYGVLVDAKGELPNAKRFVEELNRNNTNFLIVTNDASRSHEEIAERFQNMDMQILPTQVLCSGSLIIDYFTKHELRGAEPNHGNKSFCRFRKDSRRRHRRRKGWRL